MPQLPPSFSKASDTPKMFFNLPAPQLNAKKLNPFREPKTNIFLSITSLVQEGRGFKHYLGKSSKGFPYRTTHPFNITTVVTTRQAKLSILVESGMQLRCPIFMNLELQTYGHMHTHTENKYKYKCNRLISDLWTMEFVTENGINNSLGDSKTSNRKSQDQLDLDFLLEVGFIC